jgi:hypothetical protein
MGRVPRVGSDQFAKLKESRVLQILLVYAAGAWVVVEIVGFLTTTYELPRAFVDIAIVLVVSGGIATTVLAWLHGKPGRQSFGAGEKAFLIVLAVLTVAGSYIVAQGRDPQQAFSQLAGVRLILQVPASPDQQMRQFTAHYSPQDAAIWTEAAIVFLEYDELEFALPDSSLSMRLKSHPIMIEGVRPRRSESGPAERTFDSDSHLLNECG